jgi:hypothetical protein
MVIKVDSNNIITSWCAVGGIEGGITVDSIPDEVQNAPIGYYKYVDGEFVVNPDYTEPTAEPTLTTEQRLIQIDNTITDLQKMYFEILMEV